ncbi:ATP synthase F1 subunit epsilon [Candidatus Parcubacteria bacterium]|jgi:F-type H+-transporting ATPase subunit epsilon|nr:ATP synthase F1 subunit epsilon [Candidatus Parcubacteria bacterium]
MLKFKIATPESVVYEDEIFQVSIPTAAGEITVLPNHIPLVSILQAGELKITDKDGEHPFAISSGFLEIKSDNEIVILADSAERATEIDLDAAEEARKRAEDEMERAKSEENVDFAKLQAVIDREMNKVRVAKKYKNVK